MPRGGKDAPHFLYSHTWMASVLIISPPKCCASCSESFVFPTPVGPRITSHGDRPTAALAILTPPPTLYLQFVFCSTSRITRRVAEVKARGNMGCEQSNVCMCQPTQPAWQATTGLKGIGDFLRRGDEKGTTSLAVYSSIKRQLPTEGFGIVYRDL